MAEVNVDAYLTLVDGERVQRRFITVSRGPEDAGKAIATRDDGTLDPSLIGAGDIIEVKASEALGEGKFVNLFKGASGLEARLADAEEGYPANGYVKEAVASGDDGIVYPLDSVNHSMSGLESGNEYFLGTQGDVVATPYNEKEEDNVGFISQKLGLAVSETSLRTDDHSYVVL